MDWLQIEKQLCERAEEVCRHLLPEGKRDGAEYVCGDVAGSKGKSLKINLGRKLGTWTDFADAGKGGKTLMSLWCEVRNAPFRDCIAEAKRFLGIQDDQHKRFSNYLSEKPPRPPVDHSRDWLTVPQAWPKCQPLTEGGAVWKYLVEERKIEPMILALFDVREMISRNEWVMVFPYYLPKAESLTVQIGIEGPRQPDWLKFEALNREVVDGKKQKRQFTTIGPQKCLWGCQLIEDPIYKMARSVILCEGEKDALSWSAWGCSAWSIMPVSIPFGAKWKSKTGNAPSPNREWIDSCWEWLQFFETIYVAMDCDEKGHQVAMDVIQEIGPRRCRMVFMPKKADGTHFKDANECLQAGLHSEVMKQCLDKAIDFPPKKVVTVEEYRAELRKEIFERDSDPGLTLPFSFPFKIRPAELTVWTGIEKSGKSTMLSFVLMNLLAQGERGLVASLEVKAVKSLSKWARQAFGGYIFKREVLQECEDEQEKGRYLTLCQGQFERTCDWLGRSLWLYDHTGIAPWREILEDFRWARYRFGITQFVVDNMMKLGILKDDYTQQSECVSAFTQFAMETDAHVHMVVHQNKNEGHKGREGGKRSVAGAFEIIAHAHNIVEVTRDELKGQQYSELWDARANIQPEHEDYAERLKDWQERKAVLDLVPDGKFILRAQRDGDRQDGSKALWFHWPSQQYCDKPPCDERYGAIAFVKTAPGDEYVLPEKRT
jgi:twinkle protein